MITSKVVLETNITKSFKFEELIKKNCIYQYVDFPASLIIVKDGLCLYVDTERSYVENVINDEWDGNEKFIEYKGTINLSFTNE